MATIEYVQPMTQYQMEDIVRPHAEKIVNLAPQILFGSGNLFNFDRSRHAIVLSKPFQELLNLLVEIKALNPKALSVKSINELNAILQEDLKRPDNLERFNLVDSETEKSNRKKIDLILEKLGFVDASPFTEKKSVDQVLIFGALVQRMVFRIEETLQHLEKNIKVTGKIFLLGSSRKLTLEELAFINNKISTLSDQKMVEWSSVFNDPSKQTEANAFLFLWELLVPSSLRDDYDEKIVAINATSIGPSYKGCEGIRPTTQSTLDEWISFSENRGGTPESVFAVLEQPYLRISDQARNTLWLRKMEVDEIIKAIVKTTFIFAHPKSHTPPLIKVQLDEIARNVYNTAKTLESLNRL